jgi:uncharacterized protein with GYD domain
MAYFLLQGAYTTESWKSLINNPENRLKLVSPVVEKMGGKIEYDVVVILNMPDNVSAAAFSLAVAAAGTYKSSKTTPLLTMEEGIESMKKAGQSGYRPPGK